MHWIQSGPEYSALLLVTQATFIVISATSSAAKPHTTNEIFFECSFTNATLWTPLFEPGLSNTHVSS